MRLPKKVRAEIRRNFSALVPGRRAQKLFPEPIEAPIRYRKVLKKDGKTNFEILYAGNLVPAKRAASGLPQRKKAKTAEIDYGTSNVFGPLGVTMHDIPFVGTHGVLTFFEDPQHKNTILLRAIAVPDKFQGSGIAKKLLERLERTAKRRGFSRILLMTATGMRSFGFFQKNGFKTLKPLPEKITRHGSVEMEKAL